MYVNVKEGKFVRDTNSMGLINTDMNAKEEYLIKSKIIKAQKEEINNLKAEISEVKNLLKQLLEKGTNG